MLDGGVSGVSAWVVVGGIITLKFAGLLVFPGLLVLRGIPL